MEFFQIGAPKRKIPSAHSTIDCNASVPSNRLFRTTRRINENDMGNFSVSNVHRARLFGFRIGQCCETGRIGLNLASGAIEGRCSSFKLANSVAFFLLRLRRLTSPAGRAIDLNRSRKSFSESMVVGSTRYSMPRAENSLCTRSTCSSPSTTNTTESRCLSWYWRSNAFYDKHPGRL